MKQDTQPRHETESRLKDRHTRQSRHAPSGEIGHWVRTAGILAPLLIGELVKDKEQQWRFIRITSVAMALISEGLHAHRITHERRERDAMKLR